MKALFHILLFLLPSFAGGQKFLRNSIDSLYLVDIANMQSYGLLNSEKTGFADGNFEFKDSIAIFCRYKYSLWDNSTIVNEFIFDTLDYSLIESKEYTLSGNQTDRFCYKYHYPQKTTECWFSNKGNIIRISDLGQELFLTGENFGKTQKKYLQVYGISTEKLICELWHIRRNNEKLWISPPEILEIDIPTKKSSLLTYGRNITPSIDGRYILYINCGGTMEHYGVYDLQKQEIIYKFNGIAPRWISQK